MCLVTCYNKTWLHTLPREYCSNELKKIMYLEGLLVIKPDVFSLYIIDRKFILHLWFSFVKHFASMRHKESDFLMSEKKM